MLWTQTLRAGEERRRDTEPGGTGSACIRAAGRRAGRLRELWRPYRRRRSLRRVPANLRSAIDRQVFANIAAANAGRGGCRGGGACATVSRPTVRETAPPAVDKTKKPSTPKTGKPDMIHRSSPSGQ